jgi:tetratricopeptide (TPR) repeat protein
MLAEAVALLRRGLALVPALPDPDGGRRERELDLQIALGQALIARRGWGAPELGEVYARVRELASTLKRSRALLFALWGEFTNHRAAADLKRARRLAAEMRQLGGTAGDVPTRVMAYDSSGLACFHLGEFTTGRAYLEKAFALYDPAHRPYYSELLSHNARVLVLVHSSRLLACLGHLDQALLQRDAALDEARRLCHPPSVAVALGAAAWETGWFICLKPGSLLQYADEYLGLATEHGLGFDRMMAQFERGWSLAALGHTDEGIPLIATGVAGLHELGYALNTPWRLTVLGHALWMAGQWQAALGHLAEAQRLAEETEERWFQAETFRLRGDVLAMNDPGTAEASYCEAIAIAQQQSAKLWELRATISLARLWRDHGRLTDARELLAPVYDWFTEGFDTPVLQEAKVLLEELAA